MDALGGKGLLWHAHCFQSEAHIILLKKNHVETINCSEAQIDGDYKRRNRLIINPLTPRRTQVSPFHRNFNSILRRDHQ